LPLSILNLERVWVVVSDRLSDAGTIFEVRLPQSAQNVSYQEKTEAKSVQSVIAESPKHEIIEQTPILQPKILETPNKEEKKSVQNESQEIIQKVMLSVNTQSKSADFSSFETIDLRSAYDFVNKILQKKIIEDSNSKIDYETMMLEIIRSEILARCEPTLDKSNSQNIISEKQKSVVSKVQDELITPKIQNIPALEIPSIPKQILPIPKQMPLKQAPGILDLISNAKLQKKLSSKSTKHSMKNKPTIQNNPSKSFKIKQTNAKPKIQELIEMAKMKRGGYRHKRSSTKNTTTSRMSNKKLVTSMHTKGKKL